MCRKKLEEALYWQAMYEKKLLQIPGVQVRRDLTDFVSDEGVVGGCGFDQPEETGEEGEDDALKNNIAEFREFLARQ